MIKFLLIGIILSVFIIGALRRRFFAAWRTITPLIAGAIIGSLLSAKFVQAGAPAWMMIVGPVFAAFVVGGALNQGLNDIFPPRR